MKKVQMKEDISDPQGLIERTIFLML